MAARVTLIHGIANKLARDELRRSWLDSLAANGGIDLLRQGVSVEMVYWADVLYAQPLELTEGIDQVVEAVSLQLESGVTPNWQENLTGDDADFVVALREKLSSASIPITDDIVAERVPLPWFIKQPLMERLLRDVHHYLFNVRFSPRPGTTYPVRDEIRRRFVDALKSSDGRPHIVISHSMGTVIAYDCLKRVPGCPMVDALFTIGSPLGLDEIQDKLAPQWTRETGYPDRAGRWINVYDGLDPVCGFDPLLANDYMHLGRPKVKDVHEPNHGWWRHDIDKYLRGSRLRANLRAALGMRSVAGRETPIAEAPGGAVDDLLAAMREALSSFDYDRASELCDKFIKAVVSRESIPDPKFSAKLLGELRRKRRFGDLTRVADALTAAGYGAPLVRRQYIQALIDQGQVAPALAMAKELLDAPDVGDQRSEVEGLIGRGYKQWFIEQADETYLQHSLDAYGNPWNEDQAGHLWHGINLVALLDRARRHGVANQRLYNRVRTAERILEIIGAKQSRGQIDHWDHATAMEACVALGRHDEALQWARSYVACDTVDAFELGSTVRQLKEVWELDKDHAPGSLLLPLLEAELLKHEGADLPLGVHDLQSSEANRLAQTGNLEKVFGADSYQTWIWYKLGLDRCRGVARIETITGQPYGTGFLVAGESFSPRYRGETLLLTNAHVVSPDGGQSLLPRQARANFETEDNLRVDVREILESSPPEELDYSLLRLSQPITHVECVPISTIEPDPSRRQRLYAIGYPHGRTLSLSIHDNLLIDFLSPRLHYRTPTDPGSSGSPVFDDQWRLVALHHAGSQQLPKLRGRGTHEANEGIWIDAIQKHIGGGRSEAAAGRGPRTARTRASAGVRRGRQTSFVDFQSLSTKDTEMGQHQKESRLRGYVSSITTRDGLEHVREELPSMVESAAASFEAPPPVEPTIEAANRAIDKMESGQPLDQAEMYSIEAIILPRERPVVFIQNNTFQTPESPWGHFFSNSSTKANIDGAIPSIGRVELPSNLSIPFGGTAFVVGTNRLMTNRHVAELFARGLGRTVNFRTGQTAAWDYVREHQTPDNDATTLTVERILMIHPYWDMAILEVRGLTGQQQPLQLTAADPRGFNEQDVAVIGYPAKDWRNDSELQDRIFQRVYNVKRLQPGKLKTRSRVSSFGHHVNAVTHDSSTLGGNSGSAVVLADTGDVVALHFAGRYLEANYAVPTYELARDPRVAALVNFIGTRAPEDPAVARIWRETEGAAPSRPDGDITTVSDAGATGSITIAVGEKTCSFPLRISGSLAGGVEYSAAPGDIAEGYKKPFVAPRLDQRAGYDPAFLDLDGGEVPVPELTDEGQELVAKLDDGSHLLKYHKFSVCMHKLRRMALFTVANVDWREEMRTINGRAPTRKELNGFTSDASERWVTDERIPQIHQLPDVFYTKDGKAFDKGHLVRRNDVTWGTSFKDIQKANGDTFHTTNCSPQTLQFNRSNMGEDNWGDLENLIASQTASEKAIVLSGPVLAESDLRFEGVDERGEVHIQIPRRFWKIVVVKSPDGPKVYGFVQEQDLSDVPLEFAVPARWLQQMESIKKIEKLLFGAAKLRWYKDFDQYDTVMGDRVRRRLRR